MILLSLSIEDGNDLFGYPGAGNSFLGGLAAGLHLTGDIVEGDLLPTQVVNLQCIDSHALANAYNVSCHMTAVGALDDHRQASGQERELQQYTGIATAPAQSNMASNQH